MTPDYCVRCGRQGHTADECSLRHRKPAPTMMERVDRFAARFPGVAALIFIAVIALGAGIVGALDADDSLRTAQHVVFRSV